jgi:GTP cyclohydrolase I
MSEELIDVQQGQPQLKLPIKRVGITGYKLPIYVSTINRGVCNTVAEIDCFVDLCVDHKGINMSRLPIGLQKFDDQQINASIIQDIAEYIRCKSEAKQCHVIYRFPYFMKKSAPVSKEPGIVHADVIFDLIKTENDYQFKLSVTTTATSLCPCSKEIANGNGAHNQRSKITVTIEPKENKFVWIEDIVKACEECASCDVYGVLKRPDEKHVTVKAYENPKFVEDMGKQVFVKLKEWEDIKDFEIEIQNEESIHQHNAYCKLCSHEY